MSENKTETHQLHNDLANAEMRITELEREIAELRKEKERIEFLESDNHNSLKWDWGLNTKGEQIWSCSVWYKQWFSTAREAIDDAIRRIAAMKGES